MKLLFFRLAVIVVAVRLLFFLNDTATTEIYTLSLHDALPISHRHVDDRPQPRHPLRRGLLAGRGGVGLQGCAAADRISVARCDGDLDRACAAVHRRARLPPAAAARISRRGAGARARDPGDGGPAREPQPPLSRVPGAGGVHVPNLPCVHDEAEAGLRELQGAPGGALAGLSVLRDAGRDGAAATRQDQVARAVAATQRATTR